jgi:hypothetical protein
VHGSWFKLAPHLTEGTAPWPTPDYLEALRAAPAQPGAAGALAGWTPRAAPAIPPEATLNMALFAHSALNTTIFPRFQPGAAFAAAHARLGGGML